MDWSSDVCSSDLVPNLLVLVAGTTNLIERALVETIDDNTLDPNIKIEFGAGGHTFDLFFNAVSPRGPITDTFLDATIKDYVRQCYPVARVSAAYGVDDDRLFRTATDLPAAFARSEEHTSELPSLIPISSAPLRFPTQPPPPLHPPPPHPPPP